MRNPFKRRTTPSIEFPDKPLIGWHGSKAIYDMTSGAAEGVLNTDGAYIRIHDAEHTHEVLVGITDALFEPVPAPEPEIDLSSLSEDERHLIARISRKQPHVIQRSEITDTQPPHPAIAAMASQVLRGFVIAQPENSGLTQHLQ